MPRGYYPAAGQETRYCSMQMQGKIKKSFFVRAEVWFGGSSQQYLSPGSINTRQYRTYLNTIPHPGLSVFLYVWYRFWPAYKHSLMNQHYFPAQLVLN